MIFLELVYLGLNGCSGVTDECILKAVKGGIENCSNDLNGDNKLTDVGPSARDAGCGQLQSINLSGCGKVTDAGISALGAGCGQLRSISLGGCYKVTDACISDLGHISITTNW